jgi:hypothetical protein
MERDRLFIPLKDSLRPFLVFRVHRRDSEEQSGLIN